VRYELNLRATSEPGAGRERLRAALARRDFIETAADRFELSLPGGALRVAPEGPSGWDALEQARAAAGFVVDFPMGLSDADGRKAIDTAFSLAGECGFELFDPQLGQCLADKDRERVVESWRRSHSFHFEVAGRTDLGVDLPSAPAPQRHSSARLKILLALLGLGVLAVLLLRSCLGQLLDQAMNPPAASAKP